MICFLNVLFLFWLSLFPGVHVRPRHVPIPYTSRLPHQLDLFDTVMNEDMIDANKVMDGGNAPPRPGEPVETIPDPTAVVSLRATLDKLEELREIRLLVEKITMNMDRMAGARCDAKHWKSIW